MRIPIFGKELVIGGKDKKGRKVKIGVIDCGTGKGKGIYEDPDPVFER